MGCWGSCLLQSDDDFDIAGELGDMLGCDLMCYNNEDQHEIIQKLNDNSLIAKRFEMSLSPASKPPSEYRTRERMLMIIGVLAMRPGANISDEYMRAMRVLRPRLRMTYEQLQIITALDKYKNDGTQWGGSWAAKVSMIPRGPE